MRATPVFMYHSVGIPNSKWMWKELTISYLEFEKQLAYLKAHNYTTFHLKYLYVQIDQHIELPKKSIVLTFDDGYLDNYVFALPLLKKYGFKGTIFVNPEFVDKRNLIRKQYDGQGDVAGLETIGFMSWDELREIEQDGTMEIQSHALTHTWYPSSDRVIDFRHPQDKYIWMTWNSNRSQKPYLQLDNAALVKLGEPVYESEMSLSGKRFYPDKELSEHIIQYVSDHGGVLFFQQAQWRKILFQALKDYEASHFLNTSYESETERLERLKCELSSSKQQLEQELNKSIDFLCWPGGSATTEGQAIALSLGYKMTTATRDIPQSIRKTIKNNNVRRYPDRIARTSPILLTKRVDGEVRVVYCNGLGMYLRCKAFSTKGLLQLFYKLIIRLYGIALYLLKNRR